MSDARVLHVFGGKGGAGKTTLASAFALRLAEDAPKEKVLLLSSHASGSLGDVWKRPLTSKPTRLSTGKGTAGLYAAEFDAVAAWGPFAESVTPVLEQAASKGQHLSEEDVRKLALASLQGMEELAGLFDVLAQLEGKAWDRVVLDTAAASHFLRLVDLPLHLRKVLSLLKAGSKPAAKAAPAAKTAKAKTAAKGKKAAVKAEAEEVAETVGALEELAARAERLTALLRDPARTAFHLVTLAEPVGEAQTKAFFAQLRERAVPVADILVNQVEGREGCNACMGRRGLQAPHVRKYQTFDKAIPVVLVGRREEAPRGPEALAALGAEWAAGRESKALEFAAAEGPPALVRAPSMPPIAAPPLPPTRLIFFVGQGGVGKSSCAAAAAVTLTEKEGPVLLISADPLHSLSDVLQSRLTDTETQVKGTKGLYARELDHAGWFNGLRKRLKEKAEKAFDQSKAAEVTVDRELLRNLLEVAPGGIDELAGLSVLTDALVQERFKRIVVDLAPMADDTVRVVTLATVAQEWLSQLHGLLTKHKARGLGELADEVAAMLKHVKRFEAALATPTESRFVVVSRGEEGAAERTGRLVTALKARQLQVERVLINRVMPKNDCPRCESRRNSELEVAKAVEKKLNLPVTVAPALGRHPAGLRELKAFRTAWYALSAPAAKVKAA